MLLLLTACAHPPGLKGISVESAQLSGLSLSTYASVGGVMHGDATLDIVDVDGEELSVPVDLDGGVFGFVFEVSTVVDFDIPTELDMSGAGQPVDGNQLLGLYDGGGASGVIGVGARGTGLKNEDDIEIERTWFAVGVAVFAGLEWLEITVDESG